MLCSSQIQTKPRSRLASPRLLLLCSFPHDRYRRQAVEKVAADLEHRDPLERGCEVAMRGDDGILGSLFSYIDTETRVRANYPLRPIRAIDNAALVALCATSRCSIPRWGRSVAPEKGRGRSTRCARSGS